MTALTSLRTFEWTVTGMDCGSCAGKVRGAVERLPGVDEVEVSLMREKLRLRLEAGTSSPAEVEAAVRAVGFGIGPAGPQPGQGSGQGAGQGNGGECGCHCGCGGSGAEAGLAEPAAAPEQAAKPWYRTGRGGFVLATGALLAASWAAGLVLPAALAGLPFVLACLIGLAPVARRAWSLARAGMPFTIEMLMTLAATGALVIGAAQEAAMVVFLFAVGELLEAVAADRARAGIRALSALVPRRARIEEADGRLREVAAADLLPGQRMLVRPGDRIPADGTIVEGVSGIDESPVTGESLPVTRGPGDTVRAGSIATEAALRIEVTRAGEDSTIARIVRLVEEAEAARAPTERFIDRFSRYYMPAIVGLAALVAVVPPLAFGQDWGTFFYRALALLLIGCPCALVISVPATIASALSSGARRGLLIKGGAVIETLARVETVAFDKTGTLTEGRPQVTAILPLEGRGANEVLVLAAAVETGSSHPLARAIFAAAEARGLELPQARGARSLPGRGAEAEVAGRSVWVGAPDHAPGIVPGAVSGDGPDEGGAGQEVAAAVAGIEEKGGSAVLVAAEGRALGVIGLADAPRADAAEAVAALAEMGLRSVMLTGDNPRAARAIAEPLGLEPRAGLLPEDKLEAVAAMAGRGGVAMIGDGINDAPALKRAAVGIAMGAGSDVALETADAALLRNRVTDAPAMIRLSRAAMRTIHQNVALALGLKALFLVTSVTGLTGLWMAVLADTGATVLVTANALRLLAFDPHRATRG
ncbi:heavy metal translocating P-type ATPase [Rhodovulum sp. MB263]|uniref:heavy metal translocating P-type ATPase n=1 Tax=Rhodovulum sp. (strain MB263) TaxID=308754 RepID=UPI0009B7C164|nr:heavy metal translocating P-type ATPase [Rhodovulum sp. MB263]ARC90179.1 cadmium-translocating P-type ATPase [Rhodovulum sp. MB263]